MIPRRMEPAMFPFHIGQIRDVPTRLRDPIFVRSPEAYYQSPFLHGVIPHDPRRTVV
jgi:hypothetical protein